MAVTEQTPIQAYTANGVTTAFAFDFLVLEVTDMVVSINGTLQSGYTTSGIGVTAGGLVIFSVAPSNGARVLIYRDTAVSRATDYQNNGDLLASVVNRDFDRIWLAIQEMLYGTKAPAGSLRVPQGENIAELVDAASRANKLLSFDSTGQPTMAVPVAGTATALGIDLAATGTSKGSKIVGHLPAGTGAVPTTVDAALNYSGYPSAFRWLTAAEIADVQSGNATLDVRGKLQASQDAGLGPIWLPPGVYGVGTGGVIIKDGAGFVGTSAHWKRRTGYTYSAMAQSVLKYIGSAGANTCVVRASETAVGTVGADFTAPGTDDLLNVTLRDFHVDCNGLADFGIYVYRAGNQATIGNLTAEKAVKYCHVHLGCYAAAFGTFGAYESKEHGVAVGWDLFSWGTVEATCFAYTATFKTANNGTNATYVAGTGTDLDGSGGRFSVGRGSVVKIGSESNNGRACILSQYNAAGATMGPVDYVLDYLEGNKDGPYVDYRDAMDSLRLFIGFVHPGNGSTLLPQNIKIDGKNNSGVTTADSGPLRQEEWLTLDGLYGDLAGVGSAISSNTFKYRLVNCQPFFTFPATRPGAYGFNLAIAGLTTAGTQTYNLRSGYAVRHGSMVTVTGRVTLATLDGATAGQILITGLPYRVSNMSNMLGSALIGQWSALTTAVIGIHGTPVAGTNYISLTKITAAATNNTTSLLPADLTGTSLLQFTATYMTDDS